jgi:hypothetical protein
MFYLQLHHVHVGADCLDSLSLNLFVVRVTAYTQDASDGVVLRRARSGARYDTLGISPRNRHRHPGGSSYQAAHTET